MILVRERHRTLDLSTLFDWFIIYSYIGWVYETLYCSVSAGKFVNRGFLFGPVCPIYGLSVLLMILLSGKCKNVVFLFFSCALIATVLEYVVSVAMENIYGRRWWNYYGKLLNLNGRVCLGAAILFGVGGVLIVRYLHPVIVRYMNENFTPRLLRRLNMVIFTIFLIDTLTSIQYALHT